MGNISAELREKLESFYSKETFFDGLLHETCKNAEECWKRLDNEAKKAPWNYFSLPFIGEKYDGKLVCVGLNVNKGGGRNLQEMQIRGYGAFGENKDKKPYDNDLYGYKYDPGVIESFINESVKPKLKRKRKVFFEKGMNEAVKKGDLNKPKKGKKPYNGTELWHRVAVYSAILLEEWSPDVIYDFVKLAEIYEHIIYMDAIKCSPATPASKPKGSMGETCIKNIFLKELEIIEPKNILIMDHLAAEILIKKKKEENKYIGDSKDFPGTNKDYARCKIEINNEIVNVYYIVHPSCPGRGNRKGLFEKFADFVKSKK